MQATAGIVNNPPAGKSNFVFGDINTDAEVAKFQQMWSKIEATRHDGSIRFLADKNAEYQRHIDTIDKMAVDFDSFVDLRELAEQAHQEQLTKFKQSGEMFRADMDAAFREGDVQRFKDALAIMEGSEAASFERRQQLMTSYAELREQQRKTDSDQELKRIQAEIYSREHWFQASRQMMSDLSNAATVFGKKGSKSAKMFASAGALIDTYAAANAAYKAMAGIPYVGPALGIAAAAAAIASGLANVAKINSTNVAHGGMDYVPEESTYLLQRGERVIQPKQNEQLQEWLDGSGAGRPVQAGIYVDGHRVLEWIWDASRSGQIRIHEKAIVRS